MFCCRRLSSGKLLFVLRLFYVIHSYFQLICWYSSAATLAFERVAYNQSRSRLRAVGHSEALREENLNLLNCLTKVITPEVEATSQRLTSHPHRDDDLSSL